MRRRLRRLHSDQSGFTLPELLTAMGIGVVLLLAAFMLLDRAVSGSATISARQDAVQRGRLAMELITRQLRSQVCLGETRPIVAGSGDSVTFYTNLSGNPNAAQKRTLRYVASEKRLYEDIYEGSGTFPALTFPASPTRSRELLKPVVEATETVGSTTVNRPFFRYFRYAPGVNTTGALQQLNVPLSATDAPEVALVNIAFSSRPTRKVERDSDSIDATTFVSDVYIRLADPTKPAEGPACS
jgi:prepilin-type N-terminal cleavage/methylation domain-containing protein